MVTGWFKLKVRTQVGDLYELLLFSNDFYFCLLGLMDFSDIVILCIANKTRFVSMKE